MTEELKPAIKALADKAQGAATPHEAMQYAQAALNLAHVVATYANLPPKN